MIIDLCCGIGRFESPNEEVISIDVQRRTKPTIIADIRHLPLKAGLKPRLCHASPPCHKLSYARLCQGQGYDCLGIAEALEIVAACFKAFDWLEPNLWTLENPKGLLQRIMPTQIETEYSTECKESQSNTMKFSKKKTNFWSSDPRALKYALIPQDVRQKILEVANNRGEIASE